MVLAQTVNPKQTDAVNLVHNLSTQRCMSILLFFSVVIKFDIDRQHLVVQALSLCIWLLMVDLHITGRLLIGMGKKLKPVQLCSNTPTHKRSVELMWSMVHNNNSKARWGPVVFLSYLYQHEG